MGIHKFLNWATNRMPCRQIEINGQPYLRRYYVGQAFGVTFYLHEFLSSDGEQHVHNHPWRWGRALVLSGGYWEDRLQRPAWITELVRVNRWNRVNGDTFHRIDNVDEGTWTLFLHGKREPHRGWGFLTKEGGVYKYRLQPSAGDNWWETARTGREVRNG